MLRRLPPVVLNLLIVNALFFVATILMEKAGIYYPRLLGIHYFDSQYFRPWQIFTCMFTHGGYVHFFFNMFALFVFGPILESRIGSKKLLIFYLACGVGATLLNFGVQAAQVYEMTGSFVNDINLRDGKIYFNLASSVSDADVQELGVIYGRPGVGASGALNGFLVAFAMFFPNYELMLIFLPIPFKAKYFVPVYIGIDFFGAIANFNWDPIGHVAHLGGALFGFLLVKFWIKRTEWRI